jgi:hypothetical protein
LVFNEVSNWFWKRKNQQKKIDVTNGDRCTYCKMKDAGERHKNAGAPRQVRAEAYFCVPFLLFHSFGKQRKERQVHSHDAAQKIDLASALEGSVTLLTIW